MLLPLDSGSIVATTTIIYKQTEPPAPSTAALAAPRRQDSRAFASGAGPMDYPPELSPRAGDTYKGTYMYPQRRILAVVAKLHP